MARAGVEPARLAAQASKTCVAANYTTEPCDAILCLFAAGVTWGGFAEMTLSYSGMYKIRPQLRQQTKSPERNSCKCWAVIVIRQ